MSDTLLALSSLPCFVFVFLFAFDTDRIAAGVRIMRGEKRIAISDDRIATRMAFINARAIDFNLCMILRMTDFFLGLIAYTQVSLLLLWL